MSSPLGAGARRPPFTSGLRPQCVPCGADGRGHLLLGTVNQLVLVGALIAGADALVLPQSLGMLVEFLRARRGVRGAAAGCSRALGARGAG